MLPYPAYRLKVMQIVKSRISKETWFRDVVMDTVPNSFGKNLSVLEAANLAESDTKDNHKPKEVV